MKQIILDTSLIISCIEFKIDWEKELNKIIDEKFRIIILDKVLTEIDKVIEKGGKQGRYAKLAKEILKKRYPVKKTQKGHTDDILLSLARNSIIATQDKELRRRIKEQGKPRIVIRQKKYLTIEK